MGGRSYTRLDQKELDKAMKDFPPLDTAYCERVTNELFKPVLFVRDDKGEREISCSVCRHSEKVFTPWRVMDEEWALLVYARHKQKRRCPWCGAEAEIRERRYLREGTALQEFHPVVFLQEAGGVLYAQGFWATKRYRADMSAQELCAAPLFMETSAYRFRLGRADDYTREGYSEKYICQTVEGNYSRQNWIREPFTNDYSHTMGCAYPPYRVFGWEALQRSELRYCQYDLFRYSFRRIRGDEGGIHSDLMKYLTVYTQWPQTVERLMKAGWGALVLDLVAQRKKNAAILKWDEPEMKKSTGLSKEELRAWRESRGPVYRIGDYKALRKKGIPASFEDLERLHGRLSWQYETALKLCLKHGIRPGRLHRYLDEHTGTVNSIAVAKVPTEAAQIWEDWLDMAGKLGYDLQNEEVLLPKELGRKHDEAARELELRRERETREKELQEKMKAAERIEKLRQKYAAEINGFVFRPAESSREIVDEGKALQHCVGGYAERHMAGKLTIVFLRRAENPEASLYTIEMQGAELIQIHGFKNERMPGSKNPREVVGTELDAWLLWIKRGSKRDKQGRPKLPAIKEKEVKIA